MKKTLFLFVVILLTLVFVSCTVEPKAVERSESEEVLVALNFGGEYVQVQNSPMQIDCTAKGLGDNNDLYLVQVYYLPVGSDTYSPFCYGVFNDVSNLKLKLIKGQTYRITASVIVDGMDFLTVYTNLAPNPGNSGTRLKSTTTGFVSDSTNQIDVMSNFYIRTSGQTIACFNPKMDRYGAISEAITVDDNLTEISLSMKRFVFGIKLNVSGLDSGSVILSCTSNESDRIFVPTETITENGFVENLYSMDLDFNFASGAGKVSVFDNYVSRYFGEDSVEERYKMKVVYKDAEGIEYELFNDFITFYRLKETVLNVTVPSASDLNKKSLSLGFSFEENATLQEGEVKAISY